MTDDALQAIRARQQVEREPADGHRGGALRCPLCACETTILLHCHGGVRACEQCHWLHPHRLRWERGALREAP